MKNIDPKLDCIKLMHEEERVGISRRVGYMAYLEDPSKDNKAKTCVQVFIQLRDPIRGINIPGLKIRSRLGDLVTAQVLTTSLEELGKHPNVVYVERGIPIYRSSENTIPVPEEETVITVPTEDLGYTGKNVIVGIIDSGCDFTHMDFINGNGSRILYIWDQTVQPNGSRVPPRDQSIGVEYTKRDLDMALETADPFAMLDMVPPDPGAHGTHVMGIAAGNRGEDPSNNGVRIMASDADIIFVQPNSDDTDIMGGLGDSVNIAEAVAYIFNKARELGRTAVINMSFGTNSGPHDGSSLVERWIDRLLGFPGRAVVLALGNEHHQEAIRTHSEGKLLAGESTVLYWRVSPQDETPNEMEIWYSSRDRFVVELLLPVVDIEPPDPNFPVPPPVEISVPEVKPGEARIFNVGSGGTRVFVSNTIHSRLNGDNHINIIIIGQPGIPTEAGVWQVRLMSIHSRDGYFDAWIERDIRALPNNPQSNFVAGSYDRRKTLGSIQSAREAITVSNYSAITGNLADSTSYGPTRDGRRAPVVAAPGTSILAANARYMHHSDTALRTPYLRNSGTSMSAPFVAGLVACMMEKNPQLTSSQIKGVLAANAKPAVGLDYSYRIDWGNGRVDPKATIDALPEGLPLDPLPIDTAECKPTLPHSEGPFFREGAPFTEDFYPDNAEGPALVFHGRVLNIDCEPISGAVIYVWHADSKGGYDNDDPENPPPDDFFRCRARLRSGDDGTFRFRTVLPNNYKPVPDWDWVRAKHLHFKIAAAGFQPLTTELSLAPDDYLTSDFWRLNREELVTDLEGKKDPSTGDTYFETSYDFVIIKVGLAGYANLLRMGINEL